MLSVISPLATSTTLNFAASSLEMNTRVPSRLTASCSGSGPLGSTLSSLPCCRSTTPMPSALRSGGGSVFSSTPGPALGDPLSATYSRVAVRTGGDAARPLAEPDRRRRRQRDGVDDAEVALGLVRHVQPDGRDLRRCRQAAAAGCDAGAPPDGGPRSGRTPSRLRRSGAATRCESFVKSSWAWTNLSRESPGSKLSSDNSACSELRAMLSRRMPADCN